MAKQTVKQSEVKEVEQEVFVPEVAENGAVRDEKKENPMDLIYEADKKKVRFSGNWKRVSEAQLAKLESDGLLIGYDPETQEALIKEKK